MLFKSNKESKKIEALEQLKQTDIEEILQTGSIRPEWSSEMVHIILEKCQNPLHYATMYAIAVKSRRSFNAENHPPVPEKDSNKILLELTKSLAPFLKEMDFEKSEILYKLYEMLGPVWSDRAQEPNMAFLQTRVDSVWRKFTRRKLYILKQERSKDVKEYENLFFACSPHDPTRFEIAEEINRLELW